MKPLALVFAALLVLATTAHAVEPSEMLPDPVQEARARAISQSLRCVQCQNENIDESNADVAKDVRLLIRRRIVAGDSDAQILSYMRSRYGDFILLNPRFDAATVLLWTGPALILVIGAFVLLRTVRQRRIPPPPLTAAENEALAQLAQNEPGTAP